MPTVNVTVAYERGEARRQSAEARRPIFGSRPIRLHHKSVPDGCRVYLHWEGVFREVTGIRKQLHNDRFLARLVTAEKLEILELRPNHALFISELDLEGRVQSLLPVSL